MTKQSNHLLLPVFLTALFTLCCFSGLRAQEIPTEISTLHIELLGSTKPLRELLRTWKEEPLSALPSPEANGEDENEVMLDHATLGPLHYQSGQTSDPLFKKEVNKLQSLDVTPHVVIEGMNYSVANIFSRPDVNGDMGENCFIQATNTTHLQIFNRQGEPLTDPFNSNILWSQIGRKSVVDPVISYDEAAGRWIFMELSDQYTLLFAVSVTSDPLGSWYIYGLPNHIIDYPKVGIWPGAFVVTSIESYHWPVYLINRLQMLEGAAFIDVQRITMPQNPGNPCITFTPFDWNGHLHPPTDEVFAARIKEANPLSLEKDQIEVWGFKPDWTFPGQTKVNLTAIEVAPFDLHACANPLQYSDCIPQPGNAPAIENFHGLITTKIHCRNFGTHESAVLAFDANPGNSKSGIRWAELRRLPGAMWSLFQEGMVATQDSEFRFMGTIAINERGDIGLGYVVSGDSTYPSIRITGRKADDPPGEMTVNEFEIATGTASLLQGRFGDYVSMTTDPVDGSFWYTGEYVLPNHEYGTKIAGFRIRKDSLDLGPVALSSPQNDILLNENETVTIQIKNYGLTAVNGFTVGYIVDGQAPVVEPAGISVLLPDSVYTHTFLVKANLGTPGKYMFRIFTTIAGDWNQTNDTLCVFRHKLPRRDAAMTQVISLDNGICMSGHFVKAVFRNTGIDTLNSLQLLVAVNGQSPQVEHWEGVLAQGESDTMEVHLTSLQDGNNSILVKTWMPNGLEDENPGNDIYERAFLTDFTNGWATFILRTDSFPEQTTWELSNPDGKILYKGGPYPLQPQQEIGETWCLKPGVCYSFTIYDSGGNGLVTPGGASGDFTIYDHAGAVLSELNTPDFGTNVTTSFCLKPICSFNFDVLVTDVSPPPYNSGAILIQPTGGIPPLKYSKNAGQTFQSSPLFSGLLPGNYTIVVKDFTDCSVSLQVKVNVVSATDQLQQLNLIKILPNPSADGIFDVEAIGLAGSPDRINIEVMHADGRPVSSEPFVLSGSPLKGVISLEKQPAGVYFARFQHNSGYQTIMLVKSQ